MVTTTESMSLSSPPRLFCSLIPHGNSCPVTRKRRKSELGRCNPVRRKVVTQIIPSSGYFSFAFVVDRSRTDNGIGTIVIILVISRIVVSTYRKECGSNNLTMAQIDFYLDPDMKYFSSTLKWCKKNYRRFVIIYGGITFMLKFFLMLFVSKTV